MGDGRMVRKSPSVTIRRSLSRRFCPHCCPAPAISRSSCIRCAGPGVLLVAELLRLDICGGELSRDKTLLSFELTRDTFCVSHMRQRPWVLLLLAAPLVCLASSPATPTPASPTTSHHMACMGESPSTETVHVTRPELSRRALSTEPAHIEAVLSRYADLTPTPANLAQGVAHWEPPPAALRQMEAGLRAPANHKYGPALGESSLRDALVKKLEMENGLDMSGQEVHAIRISFG